MSMDVHEIQRDYLIRRLDENESVAEFNCGDEDLNEFIQRDVIDYRKALLAVSYILQHRQTGKVAAYFSLANDRISIDDFPSNTDFNRFRKHRFVQQKRMRSYPAAKLCRLGVDFYLHNGFKLLRNEENGRTKFLFYDLNLVLSGLGYGG